MKQLQLPKKKILAKYEQQVDDGTKPLAKPEVLLLPNVLCLYLHFLRFLYTLVEDAISVRSTIQFAVVSSLILLGRVEWVLCISPSQNFSRKCTCPVEHVTDHSPDCESITSNLRNSSRISSTRTILRSKRQPNRTTDTCRVGRTWDQHIRITPVNFPIAMCTKIIETDVGL